MTEIKNKYSLIIVGAGPAGLTASMYASRYKIDHLVIGQAVGGLAFEAHKICNFPTEEEISGVQLIGKIRKHAESLGMKMVNTEVTKIEEKNNQFEITTENNKSFLTQAILLATGTKRRKLNINEDKFIGKGVSYCATCDAMFYQNKTVAVIGGGDSANTSSLYLAKIAKQVYQIYRGNKLHGETIWIDKVIHNKKIKLIYNTEVANLEGKEKLERIVLNVPYQQAREINVDGLFIEIGTMPRKQLIKQLLLKTDQDGFIKVSADQKTSRVGVWAAGDITSASNNFRQIITACSEGSIAIENIFEFLQKTNKSNL
ncbi:MAG: FAD-dependent oxidoreductase [Candidatus Aenigmarchaeota archaeon]|nr:FAD-dependent oxidoreductase [Candidatus Aenigmarchaeota archaeon]